MVVLTLTILALLAVVPYTFNNVQMNALDVEAVSVAQQYLDDERNAKLHNLPMPAATSVPIDPGQSFIGGTMQNYGNFGITPDGCATVQTAGAFANVYSCSVTVRWNETSASRSVIVQSYVTK